MKKGPLSEIQRIGFQDQLSRNAGQKYHRMLQGEHSAILSTIIKLRNVTLIFNLSISSSHLTQVLLYVIVLFGCSTRGKCTKDETCKEF